MSSSTRTNLIISTVVCAILVPALLWTLPPEQAGDRWALALACLLVAYPAPFIRDWGRRGWEEKD